MKVQDSIAFVTGANRGLGQAFARRLLAAGAKKVYAAARDPRTVNIPGVQPIRLDVTRADEVAAAARECGDVSLLINNAGIQRSSGFLAAQSAQDARAELDTNFFGTLSVSQAFAPILAANGGGAIINVLSILSWLNLPNASTYSASKAAAWSLTNGLRNELRAHGTQVLGLHVAFMDTDMTSGISGPKAAPADVVLQTLAALEAGQEEVLADELTRQVKSGLSAHPGVYLREPGR